MLPGCENDRPADERQALLDLFMMGCRSIDPCPSCAVAAAMYAAAQAAHKGMAMTEELFLDYAKEVFQDIRRQLDGKVLA